MRIMLCPSTDHERRSHIRAKADANLTMVGADDFLSNDQAGEPVLHKSGSGWLGSSLRSRRPLRYGHLLIRTMHVTGRPRLSNSVCHRGLGNSMKDRR